MPAPTTTDRIKYACRSYQQAKSTIRMGVVTHIICHEHEHEEERYKDDDGVEDGPVNLRDLADGEESARLV